MGKDQNNFSVFKFFYNEIVYKNNSSVNYYNVERNIRKIRSIVLTIRTTPKNNVNYYNIKLNRLKKRLKYNLGKIVEYNNDIFEYFYLLYKTKCNDVTKTLEELPIIIVDSFYEDYKIDKKGNYINNNMIPRFTSLEKKNIREDAKKVSSLEYFIKLLESRDNCFLYEKFIKKAYSILSIKPLYNESYNDYYNRTKRIVLVCEHLYKRLEGKARYSDDYEVIKEQMEIAYKYKFDDWMSDIKDIITSYIDKIYNDNKNDIALKEMFNKTNNITYQKFCEIVEMLVNEKENLMMNYENGSYVKFNTENASYTIKFKENLINNYFDLRYKSSLTKDSKIKDYVDRAIELYGLARDLANQIFEKVTFDSSHSLDLMRNNDVNSALLIKIYDLYNPIYLLNAYQNAKNDFDFLINRHDNEFIEQYAKELNTRKIECNYHGPLPNIEMIKSNVLKRKLDFILEHCITDLVNVDLFNNYDTRNYDLHVMADGLSNDELINLYENIKYKISTFDFSTKIFGDLDFTLEKEKNYLLKAAQEFVVKELYNNMKLEIVDPNDVITKYRDICYGYLNEQALFINNEADEAFNRKKYDEFLKARNEFKEISKWVRYVKN